MLLRRLQISFLVLVALSQSALAVTPSVQVTPEYLRLNPEPIQIITAHNDKLAQFVVQLKLAKPQRVATRLVSESKGERQETFATEANITDPQTEVRFVLPMTSVRNATLQIHLGGHKGGSEPGGDGGTNYEIALRNFVVGVAPEAKEPRLR